MGTAGGSGADPGRGTHSRSELTTPHLSHLAQALNVQQLLKKKNLAFFGRFWPSGLAELPGPAPDGPRTTSTWVRAAAAFWDADCAVGSG
jgi:hypothetical protein